MTCWILLGVILAGTLVTITWAFKSTHEAARLRAEIRESRMVADSLSIRDATDIHTAEEVDA